MKLIKYIILSLWLIGCINGISANADHYSFLDWVIILGVLFIPILVLFKPAKKNKTSNATNTLSTDDDNKAIIYKPERDYKPLLNESYSEVSPQHNSIYKTALFLNWCKKHHEFLEPNNYPIYMQRDWGIKYPAKMHRQLFHQGYLVEMSLEQKVRDSKVADLKSILRKLNLPVSGKKQELIQRILENSDFDSIIEVIGQPTGYCLSQKALQFLEDYKDVIEHESLKKLADIELQTLKEYAEDGVEKYQILSTLDCETCDKCANMDGNIFFISDAKSGANLPPFHQGCRCTIVPYYDDTDLADQTRVARDPETGKTYEVPADMTYADWKEKYL